MGTFQVGHDRCCGGAGHEFGTQYNGRVDDHHVQLFVSC
jgi:hypothetical protein